MRRSINQEVCRLFFNLADFRTDRTNEWHKERCHMPDGWAQKKFLPILSQLNFSVICLWFWIYIKIKFIKSSCFYMFTH